MYWQYFPDPAAPGTTSDIVLSPTFSTYGWRWLAVQLLPVNATDSFATGGPNGTISVISATYGGNCGAPAGDETAQVAAICNGADACTYRVCVCGDNTCGAGDPPCIPDPAANCAKDFTVLWRCTADAPTFNRSASLPAEANNNALVLGCGPPPPPPVLPNVTAASGMFVRASVTTVGTWSSSNEWVNAIHAITLQAIEANLQSVLTGKCGM